jgi:preprotein translocase subunit Sec63
MTSDYPFDIFKLFFVLFLLVIVLSVLLRFTASDYPFRIFKIFFVLFNGQKKKDKEKFEDIKGVIKSHKSKKDRKYNYQKKKDEEKFEDIKGVIPFSFGNCIVCPSSIYDF